MASRSADPAAVAAVPRADGDERRRRILSAARRLFSGRGYSDVSTTEIAAEAEVARGLINHYFGTKRELYVEVVREMVRFRSQPVPEYVDGTTPQARLDESIDRWLEMVERNREAWLAAVGAEGLGHDPEIEAVLDDAREEATTRLIQVLGLGPAADAPPELHAVLRAYGGMAEAATREWLERDRWSREQVAAFLKAALPELVGNAYEAIPKQSSNHRRRETMNRTFVIGVGMTKFDKPGTKEGDYPDWAKEAGTKALADAGIPYEDVEEAFAGYCYGDSTYGQRAIYQLGLTGIPVVNVNNNCSTGSSALYLARRAIKGGLVDCALAVGFEKMEKGSLGMKYTDRTPALDKHIGRMFEVREPEESPFAPQMFGNAGRDHMDKYGSKPEHFAWIGWKNHKHSVNNPYAQFQDEYTLDEIKDARMIHEPLTKLQCSPTSDGAAAVIVASERYVDEHDLWDQAVEIAGQSMVTDLSSSFDETADCISIVGFDMSKEAARQAYEEAGISADEVDVCELHDCFSANELITYEALGFAAEGHGHELVEAEATTYGGDGPVVNPSGGLISKGHPLGATGLAQCSELTWQLRGTADKRQVDGARVALQHNIGLGGAAVVSVYKPAVKTPVAA